MRRHTAAISLALTLFTVTSAIGWLRHVVTPQEAVNRAEVILIGHIKVGSIQKIIHPHKSGDGAIWEHKAVLLVGEVLKGDLKEREIPVVIHYGIDPIVGRLMKDERGFLDARTKTDSIPKDAVELFDTGDMGARISGDIREDHIWLLRHSHGSNPRNESVDVLGLWEPQDIQLKTLKPELVKLIHPK